MLEYKLPQLTLIREVPVSIGAEGWGLAASPDKSVLYVTDSKDDLYHVDPATYKVLRKLKIKDPQLGKTIIGVNELEMVEAPSRANADEYMNFPYAADEYPICS